MNVAEEIKRGRMAIAVMPYIVNHALIGSAAYLPNPADVDFALLIAPNIKAFDYLDGLIAGGWQACSDYDTQHGAWGAVRSGNINLMVTHDPVFFDRYKTAMEVCKALRLERKDQRIAVCQIVRDGRTADEVILANPTLQSHLIEDVSGGPLPWVQG